MEYCFETVAIATDILVFLLSEILYCRGESPSITSEITKKVSETVISVTSGPAVAPRPVRHVVPKGIEDFDALHQDDPNQVGNYAHEIFEYLKSREVSQVSG